jgi:hypothetical protein
MSGPMRRRFQPKMKKSADKEQEKRRATLTRSVPGVFGCISFFAAQRDAFCQPPRNGVDAGSTHGWKPRAPAAILAAGAR